MKNIIETLQMIFASIGGCIGWILGGTDGFLYALIAFVVIDYLTGFMVAVLERKLSSEIGFRGIFKKVLIFVLVGVAHIVDCYLLGGSSAIRTAVIFFYISNEGISILENTAKIGLPIPEKLKNILEQLKEDKKNG
ncbi:phage holin family protein [Clostridium taeniosporum]|uniref:Holin n=1 Tax=Clostridium taeniosporum TaxID=394958 RepID=A0A1D7XI19_9CLOT|nr:phage holin family protein [Clostridium taeniosporum]AOR22739.1 holin [Clostridium taeniosporum]